MEYNAQRPVNEEPTEVQHDSDTLRPELETDGLVFKRELLTEFRGGRDRPGRGGGGRRPCLGRPPPR